MEMYRRLSIALLLSLILVACGGDSTSESRSDSQSQSEVNETNTNGNGGSESESQGEEEDAEGTTEEQNSSNTESEDTEEGNSSEVEEKGDENSTDENSIKGNETNSSDSSDNSLDTSLQPHENVQKSVFNHMGKEVTADFHGYTIKIVSDKILNESEETSHSTIAVYGVINGQKTDALLKINENYHQSRIAVEVYKGSQLVGMSPIVAVEEDDIAVNFYNIKTKE
jgi:hypothetical protein